MYNIHVHAYIIYTCYYLSFNPSIKSLPSCTCSSLHKLSIHPSIHQTICPLLFIHLSINQSIHQTICPLPIYSSICPSIHPSIKTICPLRINLFIHLSINQSIHQTICPLPINLFIHSCNHHFHITFKIVSLILITVL